jgi:hypothetical protein
MVWAFLLLYVAFGIYAALASNSLIFQPQRSSYADNPGILKITSGNGK